MTNVAQMLIDTAAKHGDRTAIKLDDLELSYAAVEQASAAAAGLLAERGIESGDRVGVMLPNVPYFPFVYFGALRLGATIVPLNPLLKGREVAFQLSDSGAKLIVGWHEMADAAREGAEAAGAECILVVPGEFEQLVAAADVVSDVAERDAADTAIILYTSGTTGTPKGAQLTHGNVRAATEISVNLVQATPESIALGALPLFHVFGLVCGLSTSVCVGGTLTLMPRFDPAGALNVIERDHVTTFLGVPTMYAAMLHDPAAKTTDTSSLSLCVSGGAAMPVEVIKGFEAAFDCKVLEGYGMSETTAVASFNRPEIERKPGSIGVPVPRMEMRLADDDGNEVPQGEVGEILIRGPVVMSGYYNREEANETVFDGEGWLRSGDLATKDTDGYYFIVDRKKELIIRGGFNVYPREIEEVLYEHPAVREAAVIGLDHESLGEEIGAAISLKPGAEATGAEVQAFVKERVAPYKYPRQVWILDDLPKGATGKLLKREITPPQ